MQNTDVMTSLIGLAKLTSENKAFFKSAEFKRSIAEYNLTAGIATSAIASLVGVAGIVGNTLITPVDTVYPALPNLVVYILILVVNLPHIALLARCRALREKPSLLLNVELLNLCLNAVLAGLTVLDTEIGSSFFLEFVLIMIAIFMIPYIRRGNEFLIAAVSIVALLFFVSLPNRPIAWQDTYDILMFYCLCWAGQVMRRWWFNSTQLLSHQPSETNAHLKTSSRTDELTGLLNRTALREDYPTITGPRTAVAMLDMDDFKEVNDRFGHERGDSVLRELGRTITECFNHANERCYRYGGDEFLVVATGVDEQEFTDRLSTVVGAYGKRVTLGDPESISVGYCYGAVENERNLRSFLRVADDNLYAAKSAGKNRVVGEVFHPGVTEAEASDDERRLIDPLTNLHNYTGFERVLAGSKESLYPGSIVFFDIDRFQDLNKTYGYHGGDKVLAHIAQLIERNFPGCAACRYDTDHFALFTRDADPLPAAQAVQNGIAHAVPHFYIFLRIGIYRLEPDFTLGDLTNAVDKAKYASDTLRRQHAMLYRYYDGKLTLEREREAFVLGHFDEALSNGAIAPYFQPVVTLADGRCHGFEVLARWQDPERGTLSPAVFVPVLERSFDTYRLDSYMLDRACAQLATLSPKALESAYVSFNVSRNDFAIEDVAATVDRIVRAHGISPRSIRVEITESVLNDSSDIRRTLSDLRSRGYQIWLDDFGSGESSLNVLKNYEIDGAKLDQAFLRDFDSDNEKSRTIVRALIQLCHTIGVQAVVEGVETEEQLAFVRQCGGDIVQGYYYSKPMPVDVLVSSPFWKGLEKED
ncbi:MAG: EAL domain-containing protein [Eggerthellaceae bacterium]|jgi:diguanylate cyclase (GGDEF)-like protein|nr:EAL domain-containing protein [Eggerthellaceae bacterium]